MSENSSTYGAGICVLSSLTGKGKNKNKAVTTAPVIGGTTSAQKNTIQGNKASSLGGGIYINRESIVQSAEGSSYTTWDRAFYPNYTGWPTPNYAVFNTFSGNTHGGGTTGSQVYFEARNITFSASGQGSIKVFDAEVTGKTLACPVNAQLEIQALPQTDWVFQKWSATAGTLTNSTSSTTTYWVGESNATVGVTFLPLQNVTFEREGEGSVTVSVDSRPAAYSDFQGTINSFPKTEKYVQGTVLALTATPGTNCAFSKWVVNGSDYSTNQSQSFTINQDTTIKAVFVPTYQISVSTDPANGGEAYITKVNGQSIAPATSVRVPAGTVLTIEATPGSTYTFKEWSASPPAGTIGSSTSSTTTYTTPAQDVTVTAQFELMRAVTFKIGPDGRNLGKIYVDNQLVLDGTSETQVTKYYSNGTQIQIEAKEINGTFQSWSIGGSNPQTYTVNSDITITVNFSVPPVKRATSGEIDYYYKTIKDGLQASSNGDTVLVSPGTYYESGLSIPRGVALKSTNGASQTIIDGNKADSNISMWSNTTIEGFTIQNYDHTWWGGGIIVNSVLTGESCTIKNNIITNNKANYGGGIYVTSDASQVVISNNTITNNEATGGSHGGGVKIDNWSSIATFSGNTITGNTAAFKGGGVYVGSGATCSDFSGNTISGNTAKGGTCENVQIGDINQGGTCCIP